MVRIIGKFMVYALVISMIMVLFSGCDSTLDVVDVELDYGNYERDFDDVGFEVMELDEAIVLGSDKAAAMEHILEVAETNWKNADHVARISMGSGGAYTGGIGGEMTVRSFYTKNDGGFYYQTAGVITQAQPDNPVVLSAAQSMLNQGRREYSSDCQTFYQQEPGNKGDPAMVEDSFPYFACNYDEGDLETFTREDWIEEKNIKEYGELSNFTFNEDTVKNDSITIDYNEDAEFYTLYFELNLEDEDARDEATGFAREGIREIAQSDDIEYRVYNYTMEIWENGLIRSIETEESWEGSISVAFLDLDGYSESLNKDYYSWDPEDTSLENNNIDLSWIED